MPVYERIIIKTRNGYRLKGNVYEVDKSSPIVFNYPPYNTKQDFDELNKVMRAYRVNDREIERWWTEEVKEEMKR